MYPTLTKLSQTRKPGTKTAWQTDQTEVMEITEAQYNSTIDACPFFRRMGGSETLTREYTSWGYKVTQINKPAQSSSLASNTANTHHQTRREATIPGRKELK